MKFPIILLMVFLSISLASAATLDITKQEINPIIIKDSNEPATFQFEIKNNGQTDFFEIYSLVGVTLTPRGTFYIEQGETFETEVGVYPDEHVLRNNNGNYIFEYQIRSPKNGITKDTLRIKIYDLSDIVRISVDPVLPGDESATLEITNRENLALENLAIKISSDFFEFEETLSLEPEEKKTFTPEIKDKVSKLSAGQYDVHVEISTPEISREKEIQINYQERSGLTVYEKTDGIIIQTKTTTKINDGNVQAIAEVSTTKNLLTRLFTTNSPNAHNTEQRGFLVEYSWQSELAPGESFEVQTTTNYTLPFILVLLVVLIIIGVKIYLQTNLVIKKRVSPVRTKGGEFAFKVKLVVKAKKNLENIYISDRIPKIAKLYDKFAVKPDEIDSKTRKLAWKFHSLNSGEERTLTYIIYSKIKLVGNIELPRAHAKYEIDKKHFHVESNKTSIVIDSPQFED